MEPFTTPGCDNVTVEDDVTVISSAPKPYVNVSAYTAPTEQHSDLTKLFYSWNEFDRSFDDARKRQYSYVSFRNPARGVVQFYLMVASKDCNAGINNLVF